MGRSRARARDAASSGSTEREETQGPPLRAALGKPSIEHRCPDCDTLAGVSSPGAPRVGKPFLTCPSCGTHVPRPRFDEWTLMSRSVRLGILARTAVRGLVLGLAPAVVLGLVGIAAGRTASSRATLAALGIAGAVVGLAVAMALLGNELGRSRRRMSDPLYRARLVEFGIRSSRAPSGE